MSKKLAVIILAAGKGTRMYSEKPKVLHHILGKPMIYYVVEAALPLKPFEIVPVLSYKKEEVEKSLIDNFGYIFNFAYQKEPQGTGDAIKWALKHMNPLADTVMVLSGDVPLVSTKFLEGLLEKHKDNITVVTTKLENPHGYGRIVRKNNKIVKIVEEKHATEEEKLIKEINTGIYCFTRSFLDKFAPKISQNVITEEYYLTDLVDIAINENIAVHTYFSEDGESLLGINNRFDLSKAAKILQNQIINKLFLDGVTIISPERTYIETTVSIAQDTVIYPDVFISGNTKIEKNTIIEQGSIIKDSYLGKNVHIKPYCVIEGSQVHDSATIGPFAHLRPESIIEAKAKIGNFVETKKATLKSGAKANHLAYIGDALVESNVNIGAGTITCNYDGEKKHFTHIKKGAFIGTNTSLVAPITIGENAVTGAGSVITKDVPDGALAVERAELKFIENWHKIKNRLKRK